MSEDQPFDEHATALPPYEGEVTQDRAAEQPVASYEVPSGESRPVSIPVSVESEPGDLETRPDEFKAWDMAHAGDYDRSRAAENREVDSIQVSNDMYGHDQNAELEKLMGSHNPIKARRYKRLYSETNDVLKNAYQKHYTASNRLAHQNAEDFDIDFWETSQFGERRAEMYEKRAERLEEWAGILHDHPPTDAFKEIFQDFELSPDALVTMEDRLVLEKTELARLFTHPFVPFQGKNVFEELRDQMPHLIGMLNVAPDELSKNWENSQRALRKNMTEANMAYQELVKATVIKPKQMDIMLKEAFLSNLRNGNAAKDAVREDHPSGDIVNQQLPE